VNDDYFKKVAAQWAAAHHKAGDNDLERTLYMMAKEVSREARHKAADIAQAASRDILNMSLAE
jgi:hypothetical protein